MEEELTLSVRRENEYAVLATEGYINNIGAEKIANTCYQLMSEGYKKFILNFEKSRVINSIGISILIEIIEKIIEIKGFLIFCCLTPTIAKTFKIMGLAQYADIKPTEEEAIEYIT
jgi:anti-anti-sigma factor